MIERLMLPLAMLVTVLAIALIATVSTSHATHPVAMSAAPAAGISDGPPTCCTG
jgi:hypothetical protein